MRVMKRIAISCDDTIPISITYPSEMSQEEFDDLEGMVAIWLRQVKRQIGQTILCPISMLNIDQAIARKSGKP